MRFDEPATAFTPVVLRPESPATSEYIKHINKINWALREKERQQPHLPLVSRLCVWGSMRERTTAGRESEWDGS